MVRVTIWRRRDKRDPHQAPQIAAKLCERPDRARTRYTHGYLFPAARTPTNKPFAKTGKQKDKRLVHANISISVQTLNRVKFAMCSSDAAGGNDTAQG